jgi:hypothetical protein
MLHAHVPTHYEHFSLYNIVRDGARFKNKLMGDMVYF